MSQASARLAPAPRDAVDAQTIGLAMRAISGQRVVMIEQPRRSLGAADDLRQILAGAKTRPAPVSSKARQLLSASASSSAAFQRRRISTSAH